MYVKICGATRPADIDMLAGCGADYAGIWHGTGGRSDVDSATAARLFGYATGRIHPVLVTLLSGRDELSGAVRAVGARCVQLHGYQPPATVRRLKEDGLTVIKTLHVRDGQCVEYPLIRAYERTGVDLFLLDTLTPDGRVGSTGQRVDAAVVAFLAAHLCRPFLLAGGISADRSGVGPLPCLSGVDIDSAARGTGGQMCPDRIAAIIAAWKGDSRGAPEVAHAFS